MSEFTMTIDGEAVKGKTMAGVINPATGKAFAQVPECTKEQLDEAMNAAQRAFGPATYARPRSPVGSNAVPRGSTNTLRLPRIYPSGEPSGPA
jgi:hypothetical protein